MKNFKTNWLGIKWVKAKVQWFLNPRGDWSRSSMGNFISNIIDFYKFWASFWPNSKEKNWKKSFGHHFDQIGRTKLEKNKNISSLPHDIFWAYVGPNPQPIYFYDWPWFDRRFKFWTIDSELLTYLRDQIFFKKELTLDTNQLISDNVHSCLELIVIVW